MNIAQLLILFSLVVQLSCKQKSDKIIRASIKSEVTTIDPHRSYDLVSNIIVYQMYETLYQLHYLKRPYTLEPLLAQDMPSISSDGKVYTIKIKKKIPYHNKENIFTEKTYVKPQDFLNSFKRIAFKKTDSKGWWLFKDKIIGLNEFREKANSIDEFFNTPVAGIIIPDEETIIIKLTKRYPQFIHNLAMAFSAPIPDQAIRKYANNLEDKDIGTGPFQLISIDKSKEIKLEKFKDYISSVYPSTGDREANERKLLKRINAKLPLVNELHFNVIGDDNKRWKHFQDSKLDFVDIPAKELDKILDSTGDLKDEFKKDGARLDINSSLIFWWLAFNMKDPIVGKNKLLRKAIAHAFNMNKYIENFYFHTGRLANSLYPPGVPGFSPTHKYPFEYNLKKARKLMNKAGYPDGKGLPVLEFNTRRDSERHIIMAQYVKRELNKIGISVKIVVNTFKEFLSKAKKGKMQMWQGGWLMDYPEPENILQLLYSKNANGGPNKTSFNNQRFDELYESYAISNDEFNNQISLKEMQKIVIEEVPWIFSNYTIHYHARDEKLKNFRFSDLIFNFYKYLEK